MYKWILPSIGEILTQNQSKVDFSSSAKAEKQWRVSVAACEQLLLNTLAIENDGIQGLVLAAPVPMFGEPKLTQSLQTVTFTAKPFNPLALMPFEMSFEETPSCESVLSLLEADPLTKEQFCLVFTTKFRLVLVLAEDDDGKKIFSFSFEPKIVERAWQTLAARIVLSNADSFTQLEELVQEYSSQALDHHILMEFSHLLLQQLPDEDGANKVAIEKKESFSSPVRPDVELLQAFAHEVRTPLTTIRTLTRLLLKQRSLPAKVIKRLELIDNECTEQIDRMELLFRAAELETSASVNYSKTQLTAMSLGEVLQESIPRWQQAANRRNLSLDVILPQQLPTVVSNPTMLDRVLTGVIESFTRNLPSGSQIQVQVITAGDQLKLQLLHQAQSKDNCVQDTAPTQPICKALGPLLIFQPETGSISLNLAATKHLFQAIGGKLIVRQRPEYGEVLTIFLPLEVNENKNEGREFEFLGNTEKF